MGQITKKQINKRPSESLLLPLLILLPLLLPCPGLSQTKKSKKDVLRPENYELREQKTIQEKAGLDDPNDSKREIEYVYGYKNRDHSMRENLRHIGGLYLVSWGVYPLTQPEAFREKGSFTKYRNNFGKLVFDQDEPFWNWFVHPISGSQLFLYYRANGYSRINSLAMTFISSSLFEFTIEIYTEPASIQDLYQTPIIGSLLGVGLENLSLYLLNTGNTVGRLFGHILNPSTLFWFYEGKVKFVPDYRETRDGEKQTSASLIFTF